MKPYSADRSLVGLLRRSDRCVVFARFSSVLYMKAILLGSWLVCLCCAGGEPLFSGDPRGTNFGAPRAEADPQVAAAEGYESGQSLEPFRRLEEAVRQSIADPSTRKQVEESLMRLLRPPATFEARRFACKQLGFMGSEAALPRLTELLMEPETTGIACLALTTYPPGRADELLRRSVQWLSGPALVQVLNTLGDRRDVKSAPLLGRFATGDDVTVAEAAIASLGKIGTAEAWGFVTPLRRNPNPGLVAALDEAALRRAKVLLAEGNGKGAAVICQELYAHSSNSGVRRSALAALLPLDKDGGEARILEILGGTNCALKPVAIAGIPAVKNPGSTERFASQMNHQTPEDQALMVQTLAALGDDPSARMALAKSISSPEVLVRRAAIAELGHLADPYYLSLLARAAGNATDTEETRAIEAALVGLSGGAETDKRMLAELKTSSIRARLLLVGVIAQRMGPEANSVLLEETDNSDPAVAKAAFRLLAKTGGANEIPPLIARLANLKDASVRSEAESSIAQLLKKIESSQRSKLVCEALARTTIVESRCSLMNLLPACGDEEALNALKNAAKDSDPQIRDAATRSLAEWPDAAAWDALLAISNTWRCWARSYVLLAMMRLAPGRRPYCACCVSARASAWAENGAVRRCWQPRTRRPASAAGTACFPNWGRRWAFSWRPEVFCCWRIF